MIVKRKELIGTLILPSSARMTELRLDTDILLTPFQFYGVVKYSEICPYFDLTSFSVEIKQGIKNLKHDLEAPMIPQHILSKGVP